MKTITVSRIIALCALAVPMVHSQSGPRQTRGERPSFLTIWEKYDANSDGYLSIEEFQAMPRIARLPEDKQLQLFRRIDKNEDGKVSKQELQQMRPSREGRRPAHGLHRLMELDTDGSGGVSLDEFRAGEMFANLPADRVEALFHRLDTDGDGEITPNDRPELPARLHHQADPREGHPEAHRRIFNRLDANQSGSLDFEQFRKALGIASMDEDAQEALFLHLDRDGDQNLSFDEFSKAPLAEISPPPRRRGRPAQENKSPTRD